MFKSSRFFKAIIMAVLCLELFFLQSSIIAKTEVQKLSIAEGLDGDWYGYCVDVSRNFGIVSAPRSDDPNVDCGAVYVYRFSGVDWLEQVKLTASDPCENSWFGWSAAIDGDTIVVGATRTQDAGLWTGSAYVFRFDGVNWIEEAKLLADGVGYYWEEFGYDVAIDGDRVVVGASKANYNGEKSGAVYVYEFNGTDWIQEALLLADDGVELAEFGASVDISGKTIVIGAPGEDTTGYTAGSAYVFNFDGTDWNQVQKLRASDGVNADHLGSCVSISGNTILAGSNGDDVANPQSISCNSGSAYIFRYDVATLSFQQEAKLVPSEPSCYEHFGWSCDIYANTAVVGAPHGTWSYAIQYGSAYIFRYNGTSWVRGEPLEASDPTFGNHFGWSVGIDRSIGIDRNVVFVGAEFDEHDGNESGSAYIFNVSSYKGDLNMDGKVDFTDLAFFANDWLKGS